jgi:ABC-type cobalamin transport system ATPase subunit
MKSRGVMQHNLSKSDPLYCGGATLLAHEHSPVPTQARIESAGHSIEAYNAQPLNPQPTYTPVKHRRKRAKPMPQYPKHRWSN